MIMKKKSEKRKEWTKRLAARDTTTVLPKHAKFEGNKQLAEREREGKKNRGLNAFG